MKQVIRNIALTPHLDRFVQAKVNSGRYRSASEVVCEGLRLLEEREQYRLMATAKLRQEIEIGWQQSERGETFDGPSVFAEIRRMSNARRRAEGSKK